MVSNMDNTDAIVDRLDQLILLFRVAFGERIDAVRKELRADPAMEAILDLLDSEPVASAEVKLAAKEAASVSERTVQRALTRLVERGVVQAHGKGPATAYSSTGII